MTELTWHSDSEYLSAAALLDTAPESKGIDLAAVRKYRLQRVRAQMEHYEIEIYPLQFGLNVTIEYFINCPMAFIGSKN